MHGFNRFLSKSGYCAGKNKQKNQISVQHGFLLVDQGTTKFTNYIFSTLTTRKLLFEFIPTFTMANALNPKILKISFLPSLPISAERVVKRSDDRVSHPVGYYRQCKSASLLTPDSLRCPTLSAEIGKEGSCNFFIHQILNVLILRGKSPSF